jgi:ABC-type Na+ efflux pump permease subunit
MRALAVAKKDLRELPGYFKISIVILPVVLTFVVGMFIFIAGSEDATADMPQIPETVFPPGLSDIDKSIYFAVNFMAPPFFLMLSTILPVTIAADAFAGERERKTLEALLALPMRSRDLFFGKSLLPFAYGFGASLASFIVITVIFHLRYPDTAVSMPNATWLVLIFLAIPAFCLLAILMELIISTRVDRTYYAVQMGSLIVLPMLVLVVGGVSGILVVGPVLLLALAGGVFLLDYVLLQIGADSLSRGL